MKIDYSGLPENLQEGMRRYIEQGIPPGDFLQACLANELIEAVGRAGPPPEIDKWEYLHSVCMFLYNELPSRSYPTSPWGSREAIGQHIMRMQAHRAEGGDDVICGAQ